jgi:HD-like signal output (HDOD) protein
MSMTSMSTVSYPSLEQLVLTVGSSRPRDTRGQELLRLSEDQEGAEQALTRIIVGDRTLGARLRRVASTEAVSLAHPIPTIRHAIDLLGYRAVHCAALACSFIDAMDGPCHNLHVITFWRHSVSTAMLAQVLATVEQRHLDTAFAAGLLHNVGALVLDQHLTAALEPILGFTSADLGAALARQWRLPTAVVDAIGTWRSPEALGGGDLPGLVASAVAYAHSIGLSDRVEASAAAPDVAERALEPLRSAMDPGPRRDDPRSGTHRLTRNANATPIRSPVSTAREARPYRRAARRPRPAAAPRTGVPARRRRSHPPGAPAGNPDRSGSPSRS